MGQLPALGCPQPGGPGGECGEEAVRVVVQDCGGAAVQGGADGPDDGVGGGGGGGRAGGREQQSGERRARRAPPSVMSPPCGAPLISHVTEGTGQRLSGYP